MLFFFFCYPLFRRVRVRDMLANGRSRLQAGLFTLGYIAANVLDILPDLWGLLSIFSFVFLLPVQACANRLNEQMCANGLFDRNETLSVWNWIVVVFGSLLVVLSVVAAIYEMGK
ncbi:hypothetical protein [Diaphorobacter sp. HDW4B]|uniref:hypothetical protein n=1 Tax=Diaphorobacter sp. HDW4B TaxID=2714925 RepID=UPI001F0D6058|nr:hypothetical protein [Diaphorobacter sp. HDW4B]